jgi:arylsulfatase A-like enzyme
MHGYYACVSYIDAQVGNILKTLKELKLDDKTIIVFWGDHGYKLGEYGYWSKHSNFDVDTRVPLLIRHPDQRPGTDLNIIESLDIYPTLCKLTGLSTPRELQGTALTNRKGKKLSKKKNFAISQIQRDSIMGYTIRSGQYRYTNWIDIKSRETVAEELYDHANDAEETVNLANDRNFEPAKQKLHKQLATNIKRRK